MGRCGPLLEVKMAGVTVAVVVDGATVCMSTGGARPPVTRVMAGGVVTPNVVALSVTGGRSTDDGVKPRLMMLV